MPATVGEAARVLKSGGHFCVCITHPLSNAGGFLSSETDSVFEITGSYFGRRRFEGAFERDGAHHNVSRLERCTRGLHACVRTRRFLVEALREPLPAATTDRFAPWHRIPMFLTVRLVKL